MINDHDMAIIKQIEKQIGEKLNCLPLNEIKRLINGYALDEAGQVTGLNLDRCHIKDISLLNGLKGLTHLSLNNNQITDLTPLITLTNLDTLFLYDNKITDLTPLAFLLNLTKLFLRDNQIKDLTPLAFLLILTKLFLRDNQITDLTPLAPLTELTELDLRYNQILQLPSKIASWWPQMDIKWKKGFYFNCLNLYDNPLTDPPIEIVKKGKAAIKAYFNSLKGETLPLNEVKVLLVGDGGAGKTSLVNRLMGKPFDNNEPQTPGINIDLWEVKRQKTSIKIHLWDFGGQEIMHATHQFFLSKRSLYILVLDGRKDEKIEYWLKHIRSFGGDSPVLVVLNKIDQNPGFELNRRFLKEKYPNIKDFFRLSCADETGIDNFKKALEKAAASVEIIRTNWAKSWFQVKQSLEKMTEPYISLEQYNTLCLKENITDPAGRDTLVDFLHDLGVILHFDDLGLGDVHVLEPRWATEAVYKIINAPVAAANKGILKPSLLTGILNQKKSGDYDYPPDKHHYIVELMKKFEICYQLNTGDILIPDLLAVEESRFQFDYDGSLRFIFHYDFLPPSVMPRFIVRMHNDIKDNCRWRTGVLLENNAFNAVAVIKTDHEEKKIYIYVKGQQKRDYFSVIRFIIRDINAGFENINAVEWVPLPEAKEITLEYSELIGLEKMGIDVMPIGKLGKKIPVKLLLNGYEKEEDRLMRIQEEDRLMQDSRAGSGKAININGTVGTLTIVQHEGDYSPVSVAIDNPLEEKIMEIIKLLIEHNVPGKDWFIQQLQDERVKRDKGKLREVFGKMLSVTADFWSVYSAVASLLPHL